MPQSYCLLAILMWAGVILPRAEIVINEIMYHPTPGQAGEEFIELHNSGLSAVELTGWRLDDAVRYRFEETTILPGDYLVVTADMDAFRAAYPGVSPVVGNWDGRLSNRGETVVLRDGLDRVVDEVPYADEGDWAVRVEAPLDFGHRGWAWESLSDGGGHSLELLHPAAPNAHGQSWGTSALPGGTPGRANSALVEGIAPLIWSVQHAPRIPRSTDPVVVSARVMTESGEVPTAVTLYYRRDELLPGPFEVEAMSDDGQHGDGLAGDRVYGAWLPPRTDQSVVEFFVRATDAAGRERTWPAPVQMSDGQWAQRANLLYQVSDTATVAEPPVYRLILTAAERPELAVIGSEAPDRQSNAQFNATWISDTGIAQEVRYLVGVRHRGHGSRGLHPNNFRVNFRSDELWQGVEALNLNGQYSYLQHFGSVLCQMAGLPAATSYPAKILINGVDPSELGPRHLTYGRYAVNEVLNGDFVERLFPGDDDGELYLGRAADLTNQEADFRYLGSDPGPYRAVYFKQTQRDTDDWRELIALCRMFEESSDDRLTENVAAMIQLEGWLAYFAVMTLLDNRETGLHTGFGDDFALYSGTRDRRFHLIPHDLDTILGQGNVTGATNAPLFAATRIPALNRLLKAPEIAPRYYAALGRLRETFLAPQHFNVLADQALRSYVPLGVIDNLKRFAAGRAAYVQSIVPDRLVVRLGVAEQGGIHYTAQASLDLDGEANAIVTRGILVNGRPANWSAWEAAWAASEIPLVPGLNRVIIEALGSDGAAFEAQTLYVWREANPGIMVPPVIDRDTVWESSAGPYLVPANGVVVKPGSVLTLRPGTQVMLEPDARIRIEGQLKAEGTRELPVFFSSQSAMGERWAGLDFEGAVLESRLSHCVFVGGGSASSLIRLEESSLRLEQCIWLDTVSTVIESHHSTLMIERCDFSQVSALPVILGNGIPTDGAMIIRSSRFGPTDGDPPYLVFSGPGGRRPGPILELRDNEIVGGRGVGVALNSVDAHVEGNIFHGFRNSGRTDRPALALRLEGHGHAVLARNVFADNEVAVQVCRGAVATLEHNTLVGSTTAALVRGELETGLAPPGTILLEGNILWGNTVDVAHWTPGALGGALWIARSVLSVPGNYPGVEQYSFDPGFVAAGADYRLRPDSRARGVGRIGFDLGAHVPGGARVVREGQNELAATDARFVVWGPGLRGYRYGVLSDAFGPTLPLEHPIHLSGLTTGDHTIEVEGLDSAGQWVRLPEGTHTWSVELGPGEVIINEILAANRSVNAGASSFPDLVELYNPGNQPMDLGGMSLTDNPADPRKYVFPSGTTLGSRQYLVLYADRSTTPPGYHLGFALRREGEGLYLYAPPNRGGGLLDAVEFGPQLDDFSIGRTPSGGWELNRPTFGGPNVAHPVSDGRDLKINEWLTVNRLLSFDDFVEVYNPNSLPAAIGGFYLSDRPFADPWRHRIADLSFVDTRGHVVFEADGGTDQGPDHLNFRLSAGGGRISLFDPTGREVDGVLYGPQLADVSEGRSPDGAGWIERLRAVTPEQPNPAPLAVTRSQTIPLIDLNSRWRFHQRGVDLGQDWRATDYDDSSVDWESGNGLFYANLLNLPGPISTPLNPRSPSQPTVYFRTLFAHDQTSTVSSLSLRHVVDDGVAVYLNGEEFYRFNLPDAALAYGTYAAATVGVPGLVGPITLPANRLRPGLNVVAAEVHQSGPQSADLAFGLALEAHVTVTNPVAPMVTEIEGLWLTQTTYWSAAMGEIHLWADVTVPHPHTLVIGAGTRIRLAPGVSITAIGGRILAEGTAESRVRLLPLLPGQPWGSLTVVGETGGLGLRHTELAQGQVIVLNGARGTIEDCHLHDYVVGGNPIVVSESAALVHLARCHVERFLELDLTRTPVWIEDCLFEYSLADAIDLDVSPATTLIERTIIRNGLGENTDAIDFGSGSRGTVQSCVIHDFPDKAISVGERSQDVRIHNNLIYRTGIGVAVTEFSTADLAHNTIVACGMGLQLTEKTAGEGGGQASAWNHVLWDNEQSVVVDQTSTLNLTYSLVQGGWSEAGAGIVVGDPRFRDPLFRDYRLAQDSPALATGLGGADMGALWPVGGMPIAPEDLQVVALAPSSLLLRWTDRSLDEIGFIIEQSTLEGLWEMADRIGPNHQVYLDQPTEAGLVNRYRVRAEGRWGMSFPSDAVVAGLATDRDQDGMNDDWELRHGLDPDSDHDAGLDPDGDGQSNLLEFLSGTDPNEHGSVLKLSVTRATSYSVGFGFRAEAGRAYVVEYTAAVSAGEWISGLELPPPPVVEWVEIEIPLTTGAEGYYRVRLGSAR